MRRETRNPKGSTCTLGICTADKRVVIGRLLARRNVLVVTNHDTHLKVITRGALAPVRGFVGKVVKDKTRHYDFEYWRLAMDASRYMQRQKDEPRHGLAILIHYLLNLAALPEAEYHEHLAAGRRFLDKAYTDQQAHGWELKTVGELRAQVAAKVRR